MSTFYLLLLPAGLILSLVGYVYATAPRELANRMFVIYGLNLAFSAAVVLIARTTDNIVLQVVLAPLRILTAFLSSGVLLVLLVAALGWERPWRVPIVRGAVALVSVPALALLGMLLSDMFLNTQLLYRPLEPETLQGPLSERGQVAFLLPIYSILYVIDALILLIAAMRHTPRERRAGLMTLMIVLLITLVTGAFSVRLERTLPILATLPVFLLALAFAFVILRLQVLSPLRLALEQAVGASRLGILVLGRHDEVLQINETAETLLALEGQPPVGEPVPPVLEPALKGEQTDDLQLARRYVQVEVSPVISRHGKMLGRLVLLKDVTEERQREEELRSALAAAERLADAVRELAVPLVPLRDDVLLLPLVGSFDQRRAAQVQKQLLHAVADHRARTVLVDFTALTDTDFETIELLLKAMRGVRLLGAEVVLVGLRADTAALLSKRYNDLAGLPVSRDVQDGMALADDLKRQANPAQNSN